MRNNMIDPATTKNNFVFSLICNPSLSHLTSGENNQMIKKRALFIQDE